MGGGEAIFSDVAAIDGVARVGSPYDADAERQIANQGPDTGNIVRELAAGGDAVVACDIDRSAVVDLVAGLSRAGLTCQSLAVDVTDATQVDRVVDATVERFGRLDVLVINAGIGAVATKRELAREVWDGSST